MFLRILAYVLAFSVAVFMSANVTDAQIVTDGLVGYWPLDENTIKGNTVEDVWGENDGTLQGNAKMVEGQVGGALKFDGDDFVDIPGTDALNFAGKNELSVMAWVNAENDSPVQGVVAGCCGTIVAQRDVNGWALRYDGRNPGDEMEFIVHTGAWVGDGGFGAPRFNKGEWHHLAAVLDGKKLLLYVDGKFLKEIAFAGAIASNGPETEIGKAGDGGFIGIIDEVAIYNKPLSADEAKANFNAKGFAVEAAGKLAAPVVAQDSILVWSSGPIPRLRSGQG
jgi:hypothetical protein